jgi:hypothetical protein
MEGKGREEKEEHVDYPPIPVAESPSSVDWKGWAFGM